MEWRQLRIVSADFGPGAFRVQKEEEIVDRDDLRRLARGNEKRMRGVDDVDVTRQRLDGRPLEAVPQVVEDRNRQRAIDDAERAARARGRATVGLSRSS